jgi:hypothetical protein
MGPWGVSGHDASPRGGGGGALRRRSAYPGRKTVARLWIPELTAQIRRRVTIRCNDL